MPRAYLSLQKRFAFRRLRQGLSTDNSTVVDLLKNKGVKFNTSYSIRYEEPSEFYTKYGWSQPKTTEEIHRMIDKELVKDAQHEIATGRVKQLYGFSRFERCLRQFLKERGYVLSDRPYQPRRW